METKRIPAVEGWFDDAAEPALIGSRCSACGTYVFPKQTIFCRNPACDSMELIETPLSRRGRVWSYAINHYPPPPPYVADEAFTPFGVAAVQLEREQMIVLGQVSGDAAALNVGDEVEVVVEPLFTDDDGEHTVWKWRKA